MCVLYHQENPACPNVYQNEKKIKNRSSSSLRVFDHRRNIFINHVENARRNVATECLSTNIIFTLFLNLCDVMLSKSMSRIEDWGIILGGHCLASMATDV